MEYHILTGLHTVISALECSPGRVETVWVSDARRDTRLAAVIAAAASAQVTIERVPRERLDQLAGNPAHQGVVARCRPAKPQGERELSGFLAALESPALILVLDGVQDPHNLGACLRSADAAGAHAVVVPRDHTAPLSPVVYRAASGAAETVPLFQVANLSRALNHMKSAGIWLVGADHAAEQELYDVDLTVPLAFVLGGEGRGLRRLTRERCDWLVRLPMRGRVSSLNVSVAAGVCLYEALRQRRGKK